MEHDAVQTTRRKIGKVAGAVAVGLAATAFATVPAWATTPRPAAGATAPAGKEPGSPTPAPGEELIISTHDGNVFTIDPSNTDACQNQPAGLSSLAADSPLTMTPDGTVWTAVWHDSSQLDKAGVYNPASVNWADSSQDATGPAAPHDVAGLLAMNSTQGVATGYYSGTLMSVNFKTGTYRDIGALPASAGDGLTWATNGDLLMAGYQNHLWRLPAAVLQSALNGNPVRASDWLDLGSISAEDWSNSAWYDPFTWASGSPQWWNPFSWAKNGTNDHIYGLATGTDGTLYLAMKSGNIFTLAPGNVATTADSTRALQVEGLRNLTGGTCSFAGSDIDGLTDTAATTLFAPASSIGAANVSLTAGTPATGNVTTGSGLTAPVTATVVPSTLPAGVSIGADGTISGTPVAAGTTTAQVKLCNQNGCSWRNVVMNVAGPSSGNTGNQTGPQKPPPADPTITLNGSANAPLSGMLPGAAAAAPSTFTVTDPSQLPPGVSIDQNGNLMGIPAGAGNYPIPVKACNATGCTTGTVTLTIGPDQTPCADNPASTVAYVTAHTRTAL